MPFLLLRFSVEALDGLTDDLPNFFVFILASLLRVVPFFRPQIRGRVRFLSQRVPGFLSKGCRATAGVG